jgi:predicted RNase H-like HicB family nuclease
MMTHQVSCKETEMGHIVRIQNRKQFIGALRVLDQLPGTWHSRGPAETPVLLVLDSHFEALVRAGVVSPKGKDGKPRGKKASAKKPRKDYHMKLKAFIYEAEEGGYWAKVPAVPGCVSVGETLGDVKANILDVLEGCLAAREEMARQEGHLIEEMSI